MRSPRPRPAAATTAFLGCALLLLTLPAGPASASWLPLAVGNAWVYVDEGDEPHTEAIVDIAHVGGRRAFVKQFTGGIDDGLLNFWQEDADGSVLLLGYYKPWIPFGLVYDPPVRIFPGDPVVGYEWQTHTVAIAIPDNAFFGEFDTYWKVKAEYTLTVLAGTFHCIGVGQVAPPVTFVRGQPLGLDGRARRPASSPADTGPESAEEWYSDGTGLVQANLGAIVYQLSSATGPTPARASTWGRLKSLYR